MSAIRVLSLFLAAALVLPSTSTVAGTSSVKISKAFWSSLDENPGKDFKAWIFFTNKGNEQTKSFAPRRVKSVRRAKYRNAYLDRLSLPVVMDYVKEIRAYGVKVRTVSRWLNAVSVEADAETLEKISELPFVMRIERVSVGNRPQEPVRFTIDKKQEEPTSPPSVTLDYGPSLEQAKQVNVPALHAKGLTGKGVTVCLLDVGFRKSHEAFKALKLIGERDFVMGDNDVERNRQDPNDYDDEHGTMTWSVLGGYSPGKIIGPAYGAQFLLGKTEDARSETPVEEDYWVAGLEWAEANGADIVSSSLGYLEFDDGTSHPFESLDGKTVITSRAANIASDMGVLVVNSMGNSGPGPKTIASPADSYGVLSVGAVNSSGFLAGFSSRGPTADGRIKPDVVARGVQSYMATSDSMDSYGRANGTSFSAPLVAGVAALLVEAHADWSPKQLMDALRKTASQAVSPDNEKGYGLVNAMAAADYRFPVTVAEAR